MVDALVSIPFIAGQWSLPGRQVIPGLEGPCFNPLHCGAVVASGRRNFCGRGDARRVSIPFIAGQWSLLNAPRRMAEGQRRKFQSPSLRGSGRFTDSEGNRGDQGRGFNPLHCGAVVASVSPIIVYYGIGRVSIPFIAGQWSLLFVAGDSFRRTLPVSIPFIAGQWSLQDTLSTPMLSNLVSIPFIAGQWSLPGGGSWWLTSRGLFQSPSLRGSGRFIFFDPMKDLPGDVSIPFIAGQWSLLPRTTPSSLFGVLLRKRRLPCDHIICTRLPF